VTAKRPFLTIPWHAPSDQPQRIADRALKRRLRWHGFNEYLLTGLTAAFAAPLVAWRYATMRPPAWPLPAPRDFIGIGVSPLPGHDGDLRDLVAELGVRHLLVRVPIGDVDRLAEHASFIAGFPGCEVVVAVPQDRAAVCDPLAWERNLRAIIATLHPRVRAFQIGQAPNRTKWGCLNYSDYVPLAEAAQRLRADFPTVRLVGPALIDFEPLVLVRSLLNAHRYRFDAVAALLYVDRRGAPSNRQYGFFDLARKIRLHAAVSALSPRLRAADRGRLWITETNWPLIGAGEHAPTSPQECVSESDAATYLRAYFQQAHATGLVERVYWWQLVAAGYGLVDPRYGALRRRPAFGVLADLLAGRVALGRG